MSMPKANLYEYIFSKLDKGEPMTNRIDNFVSAGIFNLNDQVLLPVAKRIAFERIKYEMDDWI